MNNKIKEMLELDHFENLEELKQNVENWIVTDEDNWTRWFGLRDMEKLLNYFYQQIEAYQEVLDEVVSKNIELNKRIDECADDILKEINENNHLSVGVALAIRQKLIDYREIKESK